MGNDATGTIDRPGTENCLWQHGLPDLYRQDLLDERGQQWYAGTFVKDGTTFFQSQETADMPRLVGASNIFGYSHWLLYPIDESIMSKPPTDVMWTRLETIYKRFLGRCSNECYETSDCVYAFGVMKWLLEDDFSTDWTLDDDFYNANYGYYFTSNKAVYFKCYKVTSDTKYKWPYAIDPNYDHEPCYGTKQWRPKYGTVDRRMMFTHFMPRNPNEAYVEKGYCSHCIWSKGILDPNMPDKLKNKHKCSPGTVFALDKPNFQKRKGGPPQFIDFPKNSELVGVTKIANDIIRFSPFDSSKWDDIREWYHDKVGMCTEICENDDDCYAVNAVASYVNPQDVNFLWDNDIWSYFYNHHDICDNTYDKKCEIKIVLAKCYYYPRYWMSKFVTNYGAIDEDYEIQGTRQFKVLGAEYEERNPMGLFSHVCTRENIKDQLTPCPHCTWEYGQISELARTDVLDAAGQLWQPKTFVPDSSTLFRSKYTRDMLDLILYLTNPFSAVNVLDSSNYLDYTIGEDVRFKPYVQNWTRIETMYKKYLGLCSYRCYKTHECKYAFGVMKWITDDNIYDQTIDGDLYTEPYGKKPHGGVFFKCYGVTDPDKLQYDLDMNYKIRGTYQWKAESTDDQMLFTHVWSKSPKYEYNGYCPDCRWRIGLPDESFEERDGWKLGTLARDKPIFEKQPSTDDAIQLLSDWDSPNSFSFECRKATMEPFGSDHWVANWSEYTKKREECKEKCNSNASCAGVNAVAAYITYEVHNNPKYEQDIQDLWMWGPDFEPHDAVVVFKCYGYTKAIEVNYLTAIDKDYKVHGTRQFKTMGGEPDLRVVYSHYWSKSNFVVTPCNNCTWQYGIPSFFRKEVSDEKGQKWTLGTFDNTRLTLFQSPLTDDFTSTIAPVSIFRYTHWLQNDVDSSILIRPHDDKMWPRLQNTYQRFLGRCSQHCHEIGPTNCEYSFAVLKYITDGQINDPNVKLDDDIASLRKGAAVYFKCYSVPKSSNFDIYSIKYKEVRGTYQWRVETGFDDKGMLSTHYWKNEETYTPKGVCKSCVWQYGLPPPSTHNEWIMGVLPKNIQEWRIGTLANEKPAFLKQNSTEDAIVLDGPLSIGDDIMRFQPLNVEPFDAKWDRLWTRYYTPRLDDCKAQCAMRDDCAGAWAVVGHLDGDEVDDSWDKDIYDKYHLGNGGSLVYKCYGYTSDKEKYLTYVDTTYEVYGTRQFSVPTTSYQNDYKVLYSHYWSKSGYLIPKPGATWYTDYPIENM